MTAERSKSDLIDLFHHEHRHFARLLDDLKSTFVRISTESDVEMDRIESAAEDLRQFIEDMLLHFAQEEEVFFVEIGARFPEHKNTIAQLTDAHEVMSGHFRWLQRILTQDSAAVASNADRVREVIAELEQEILNHSRIEDEVFTEALGQMTQAERDDLLREMRKI